MSLELFELEKSVLETELDLFRDFFLNNLKMYEVPNADISRLEEWYSELKKEVHFDVGKTIETALQETLITNWKLIFKIDNEIDDGKSLEDQVKLLSDTIDDLNETGKISTKHFKHDIVKIVNREFLNLPAKVQATIEELSAEKRLCNPNIKWIDAMCDRIRIAYYSVLMVVDRDKIERLLQKVTSAKKIDVSYDINNYFDDIDKYIDLEQESELPANLPVEKLEKLFEKMKENELIPNRKLNFVDILSALALSSHAVGTLDDIMDLEEDIEKNKITGVTQCINEGISTDVIFSTLITFLIKKVNLAPVVDKVQLWVIEILCFMYHDQQKCLDFCKSISPELFNTFFQRK